MGVKAFWIYSYRWLTWMIIILTCITSIAIRKQAIISGSYHNLMGDAKKNVVGGVGCLVLESFGIFIIDSYNYTNFLFAVMIYDCYTLLKYNYIYDDIQTQLNTIICNDIQSYTVYIHTYSHVVMSMRLSPCRTRRSPWWHVLQLHLQGLFVGDSWCFA